MRRMIFLTVAAVVAVVPAALGLAGNATLSQSVPALVPPGAVVLPTPDDHGGDEGTSTRSTSSGHGNPTSRRASSSSGTQHRTSTSSWASHDSGDGGPGDGGSGDSGNDSGSGDG